MDIENMHPFCLPFGLCHDAASSPDSNEKNKNRSKASSPSTDELFRHLNSQANNNSSSSSLLLNTDDLLIGSSSASLGGNVGGGDLESFYSLELDINTDTSDDINFHELDDESDLKVGESALNNNEENNGGGDCDEDDWYYGQFSLFSPPEVSTTAQQQLAGPMGSLRNRKSSLIIKHGGHHHLFGTHSHLHHHLASPLSSSSYHHAAVFQHDPIDIKSSPTLAQLNLNSQDDPTDGLWDTPAATTATTTSSSLSSSTAAANSACSNHHQNSNSNSSSSSSRSSSSSNSSSSSSISSNNSSVAHCGSAAHATLATNNLDLSSNCTSISNSTLVARNHHTHHPRNQLITNQTQNATAEPIGSSCGNTCNHLHHQLHHRAHHHSSGSLSPYSHLSGISASVVASSPPPAACHRLHQHHGHHHQQQQSSLILESAGCRQQLYGQQAIVAPQSPAANSQQSTCLAVAPFRKPDVASSRHSPAACCHHQHQQASNSSLSQNLLVTAQPVGCNANALVAAGPNLKPPATLSQLNQQQQANSAIAAAANRQQEASNKQANSELLEKQMRSASPALVSSSSSPLSSSCPALTAGAASNAASMAPVPSPATPTAAPASTTVNTQNRTIDNKLKENIEYLTALLCNGNKLEAANGSSGNSSVGGNSNNQQPTISSTMARSYATLAHTLSTGPKLLDQQSQAGSMISCVGQQQRPNANQSSSLKRAYPEQHWFKPQQQVVESSVSAADSTESPKCQAASQQLGEQQQACSMTSQHHSGIQQQPPVAGTHRSSELKVLSSLLSSNKCPAAAIQPPVVGWPQLACHHHHHLSLGQQQQPIEPQRQLLPTELQSIPPNGKPITLTPISSHNNPIIAQQGQQQQQKVSEQLQKKPRSNSLFAQPASPSASSGGSATTSGDTGLISQPIVPIKRQRASGSASSAAAAIGQQTNLAANNGGGQAKSSRSGRPNSMSTDCSLSSHDEGFSSQIDLDDCQDSARESDDDDDVDSDDESFYGDYTNSDLIGASISDNAENKWTLNMGRTRRNGQKRYFWQYNVQSKGPKGTRICSADDSEDPFVLPEASDPVFSNDCQVEGVKHSGKARRGDGNDLTPNPRKLLMIGLELKKLGKIINELAPVTDLPVNARNKTRKEKNKLASRACRLKKKAQHEANKIKLYGLQREHQQVVLAIYDIRKLLNETLSDREASSKEDQLAARATAAAAVALKPQLATNNPSPTANSNRADDGNVNSSVKTIAEQCSMKVAGQTSDYVNSVLEKVVSGCIDGGLQT